MQFWHQEKHPSMLVCLATWLLIVQSGIASADELWDHYIASPTRNGAMRFVRAHPDPQMAVELGSSLPEERKALLWRLLLCYSKTEKSDQVIQNAAESLGSRQRNWLLAAWSLGSDSENSGSKETFLDNWSTPNLTDPGGHELMRNCIYLPGDRALVLADEIAASVCSEMGQQSSDRFWEQLSLAISLAPEEESHYMEAVSEKLLAELFDTGKLNDNCGDILDSALISLEDTAFCQKWAQRMANRMMSATGKPFVDGYQANILGKLVAGSGRVDSKDFHTVLSAFLRLHTAGPFDPEDNDGWQLRRMVLLNYASGLKTICKRRGLVAIEAAGDFQRRNIRLVAHSDVPEFQAMVLGWHEGFQGSDEPLVSRASQYLVWSWINELLTSNSEAEILFGFEFLGRYFPHLSSEVPEVIMTRLKQLSRMDVCSDHERIFWKANLMLESIAGEKSHFSKWLLQALRSKSKLVKLDSIEAASKMQEFCPDVWHAVMAVAVEDPDTEVRQRVVACIDSWCGSPIDSSVNGALKLVRPVRQRWFLDQPELGAEILKLHDQLAADEQRELENMELFRAYFRHSPHAMKVLNDARGERVSELQSSDVQVKISRTGELAETLRLDNLANRLQELRDELARDTGYFAATADEKRVWMRVGNELAGLIRAYANAGMEINKIILQDKLASDEAIELQVLELADAVIPILGGLKKIGDQSESESVRSQAKEVLDRVLSLAKNR